MATGLGPWHGLWFVAYPLAANILGVVKVLVLVPQILLVLITYIRLTLFPNFQISSACKGHSYPQPNQSYLKAPSHRVTRK